MANKNNQPDMPEEADAQLMSIEQLRVKAKTPASTFAGLCAAHGWRPGKMVTVEEYAAAANNFSKGAINKAVR